MAENSVTLRNDDMFIRTRPTKDVTVSVTINVAANASEALILENAAEALMFYSKSKAWKVWASKIKYEVLKRFA